ncbi:PspC domain-containing protein [Bowmanella denitrificans]|nr:PspC domain-containing protein [Bowmanella denitrificans]
MRTLYDDQRIRKDKIRAKLSGVCAGLAQHWNTQPWMIRLAALVIFFHFPVAMLIAYVVAAMVLPSR